MAKALVGGVAAAAEPYLRIAIWFAQMASTVNDAQSVAEKAPDGVTIRTLSWNWGE
jgi:hypothetical protein